MPVGIVQSSLQLTTTVQVTNVSAVLETRNRKIEQEIAGLWKLFIEFPGTASGARAKPTDSLRIYVAPSLNPRMDYSHLGVVTVTLTLESLQGETQKRLSYEWDMSNDSNLVEEKWISLMTWSQLWTDNPDIQHDNGFRVVVSLSSIPPPTRPVVSDPLLLNNILELMQGQDIIDTKFLVYSKRYELDGACEPLPVYANAELLRSQCDYFNDRKCELFFVLQTSDASLSPSRKYWAIPPLPNPSSKISINLRLVPS